MKIFYILLLLGLLWDISYLNAQSDLRFEQLSVRDGLSQNSVTSILQDQEGFMWFGTEGGLNKYDGYTFKQYHPDPKNPQSSLKDNLIRDIYEDSKGRLWVSTTGLHLINKLTDKISGFLVDSTQFTYLNIGLSILEDRNGEIWFSAGGGLNKFDPETQHFSSFETPQLNPNFGLVEDDSGTFWMGSGSDLFQFDPKEGKFTLIPITTGNHFISALLLDSVGILWIGTYDAGVFHIDTKRLGATVKSYNPGNKINKTISNNGIFEDKHGLIWLATSEGLQQIDRKKNSIRTFTSNPNNPSSISSNNVLSVYQDNNGILWVGTDNGLNKASTYSNFFFTHQINVSPSYSRLDVNKINSIVEDKDGKVWLGTVKGLYQLDIKTNHTSYIPLHPGKVKNFPDNKNNSIGPNITIIREDTAGRLWIGSGKNLYLLNRQDNFISLFSCKIPVNLMAIDHLNKIWIPGGDSKSGNAILAVFDIDRLQFTYTEYALYDSLGLRDRYMHDVIASRTGDIYVASGMWGLGRKDINTGSFSHILPNPNLPGIMAENDLWCLYEDPGGIIWAGTKMGGLIRFDPETRVFSQFTSHDGLPSNQVLSITGDTAGNLWLGTGNGLSCLNPNTGTIRNFDLDDGLPDNAFRPAAVYGRYEKIFFGTSNGLLFFDPDSIQDNPDPPRVYITGLKVLENQRDLPKNSLALPHDQNFISFDFTALDYQSPEKLRYAYILENFNEDWIESDKRRYAAYTDLNPGEYVFRVKASNREGIWNEGASLPIVIHPPWWKTKGAYILYTVVGLGLLLGFRQFTMNQERMKANLKIKEMEAEHLIELEKTRSMFFANISHEFRTPLTLILGPLETLLGSDTEKPKQSLYLTMERNARRLLLLINQLLELSKLDSNQLKLEVRPQNLEYFFKILISSFHSLAESKNIKFESQWEGIDHYFIFDGDKLEKITGNLLSNALKFTPDGGLVKVNSLFKMKEGKGQKEGSLIIRISDTGIGIEKKEIEHIFDRFYQVDGSKTRKQGGTGIGLALVKELVELHQGTIMVESEVGIGTTFTIKLPIKKQEIKEESPSSLFPSKGNGFEFLAVPEVLENSYYSDKPAEVGLQEEKPRLLIVEDNEDLVAFIAAQFYSQFDIMEAYDGKQGLQAAIDTIPDVIISDVMMPEMDGIHLCEILKTDERTSHIPIILLTAKAGEKDKLEGLDTGADDFLTKPFNGMELKTRVNNLIAGRKRLRARFSREVTLQPKAVAITSADEKFLERIMAIIEANYMESDFSIDHLEKEAGLSRTQFYRKLKALTDQAPGEFLRNFRLQKAAILLKGGQGNITEAAYGVGFNSLAYFTRCFREFYGMSPSEYMGIKTASGKFPAS